MKTWGGSAKRLALALFAFSALAFGQGGSFPAINGASINAYTVATLPVSPATGTLAIATDASTAGSCTVGSGTAFSLCRYTGAAWATVGGSGGSGTLISIYTVSALPASPSSGLFALVTDASPAGSCSVGGGSGLSVCESSGGAWHPIGAVIDAAAIISGTLNHARLPSLVSGDIPNNAANTSGLAGTATALASAPSLCSAGSYTLGVNVAGNAQSCTALPIFPSGTLVGTSDTQTLTNKTLDGVSPTTMGFLDATSSIQTQLNVKAVVGQSVVTPVGGVATYGSIAGINTILVGTATTPPVITADITSGVCPTGGTVNQPVMIVMRQDGTGGHKNTSPSCFNTQQLIASEPNSVTITQFTLNTQGTYDVNWSINSTGHGICTEGSAPTTTPAAGVGYTYCSSADHRLHYVNASGVDTPLSGCLVNAQTGTSYPVVFTDYCGLTTLNNAGAVGVTLPVGSTTGFGPGWFADYMNYGAGLVTFTPTTSTINNGAATFTLSTGSGVRIFIDGSNNYQIQGGSHPLVFTYSTLNSTIPLSATRYGFLSSSGFQTTEITVSGLGGNYVMGHLVVLTTTAQPASGSLTVTLRKTTAGVTSNCNLTVTFAASAAAGVARDDTHTCVIGPADMLDYAMINAATAVSAQIGSINIQAQ